MVVLGTGAAGLTAAVRAAADGARVGLFERGEQVGGTSAWSGGVAWLPNNRHEAEAGFADSREEVLAYLESLSHGLIERPMIEAFADTAPEVVDWLEAHTPVEFETLATPPYYATRVRCGALGTKGGPRTDVSGRVLDVDGRVIDGLYAAGNAMGSIMGMTYSGHGGTLGPGLVFGYLAGRDAAARAAACGSGRHGR